MAKQNDLSSGEFELRKLSAKERWQAYRDFLGTMWRANPWLAFFRLFLIIVSAILQPLFVYVFALLIGAIGRGDASQAPFLIALTVGVYGAQRISNDVMRSWIESWHTRSTTMLANEEIYGHLARLSPEILNDPELRRDLDFAREDLWRLNNLPNWTEQVFRGAVQIIGAVALGTLAPWWVFALVLAISILQAWNAQGESRRDVWSATWNSYDGRQVEYVRYLFLGGDDFKEIRLLGAAVRILNKYRAAGARILARFRAIAMRSARWRGVLALLQGLAYGLIVIVMAPPAFKDPAQLGSLYIALNLFSLFGDGLGLAASAFGNLMADLSILTRIRHLMDFPVEKSSGFAIPKTPLVIEFRDVSYHYRHAKKEALSHVSLTIREGEHLAVVGENGAGKSTFLRLLSGLDRPSKGIILVNGRPLYEYKPEEWRRAFHLMLQDAKLFQDYVGENLQYGEAKGKWREAGFPLQKSLTIAGANAVIRDLKNGLGTFIGDWAAPPGTEPVKVSGGQMQRLVIARTLVHGGRFICFDEPTSAMDALAETAFFERLHESLKGHGIIYISHRFSTVRRASRILVFDHGRLMEDGTHESLVAKQGTYAKLYQEQAKWYQ